MLKVKSCWYDRTPEMSFRDSALAHQGIFLINACAKFLNNTHVVEVLAVANEGMGESYYFYLPVIKGMSVPQIVELSLMDEKCVCTWGWGVRKNYGQDVYEAGFSPNPNSHKEVRRSGADNFPKL